MYVIYKGKRITVKQIGNLKVVKRKRIEAILVLLTSLIIIL